MSTEPKTGLNYWAAGALQQDLTFNAFLKRYGAIGEQPRVLDKDLTAPPGAPADGATYIVGPAPTGLWAGHATHIAYYDGISWNFFVPLEGWHFEVVDEDMEYRFDGAAWASAAGGITALTGDVTAAGAGSVPATLANAQPGAHAWALTQTFTLPPVFTDQPGSRAALSLGTMATEDAADYMPLVLTGDTDLDFGGYDVLVDGFSEVIVSSDSGQTSVEMHNYNAGGGVYFGSYKARGTRAVPAPSQNGDYVFHAQWGAANSAALPDLNHYMAIDVDGAPTLSVPMRLTLQWGAVTALVLSPNGSIDFGVAPTFTDAAGTRLSLGLGTGALLASDTDTTLAANSDARLATQKAVKAYIDNLIAASDAVVYKGVVNCAANPNYPAADAGHLYVVSVAGKIGGAAGIVVEAGDMFICKTDGTAAGNQATVGANWNVIQTNITYAPEDVANKDIDGTLAANSDVKYASQKATKTYVDAAVAFVIQRANHTGTQLASTISDFATTVRGTVLTGLSTVTAQAVVATDSVLQAIGYLQAQVTQVWGLAANTFWARGSAGAAAAKTISDDGLAFLAAGSKALMRAAIGSGVPIDVQAFTASGTWTAPTGGQTRAYVVLVGPGGGGGSGRRGAAATIRCGGGGGASGGRSESDFSIVLLGATVAVTIGAKGTGGTAQTVDNNNGVNATDGGTSTFGSFLSAIGGAGGNGGTATSGNAGSASTTGLTASGGNGAAANATGLTGAQPNLPTYTSPGGASGAGITAADATSAGGAGRIVASYVPSLGAAVAGGAANGGNGNPGVANDALLMSTGTSGGGSSKTTAGGTGGSSPKYGGGGAGGGASLNGFTSGAGGDGADGYCIVVSY